MMMRRKISLVLLCLPLAGGCHYHRTLYSPTRPEESGQREPQHRFTMIRAVTFFPFINREWDLNLAIHSDKIREGAQVEVPSSTVQAVFTQFARPDRVMAVPTGTIRFLRVLPDAVQAEVDLRANVPSKWAVRRTLWFRYSPMAATEMPWIHPDTAAAASTP
jgi:hypothetical protein